jgi:spore coat polysaccharide biosynthesis predicted glycosyltransferase SpsG
MAEGDAAIHAPGALLFEVGFGHVKVKFLPVADTLRGRTVFRQFAEKL